MRKAADAIRAVKEILESEAFSSIATKIADEDGLVVDVSNKEFFRSYLSPYRNFP